MNAKPTFQPFHWLPLLLLGVLAWAPGVARADAAGGVPRLLTPVDGMEMTDVATYFRWLPMEGCTSFDIQIATDANFKSIFKEKRTLNKGYHKNCYFPKDVLPAGTYYWRVRTVKDGSQGPWSPTAAVKVNDQHPVKAELVRQISSANPLFLMRSRIWNPLKYSADVKQIIPDGLEHVIIVDDLALASENVIERAKKYQELGLDFVIWNNRCQVALSMIEYVFQNFSHCIGTAEGEHFSGMYWERGPEGNLAECDFVHRAWTLCAKYGRYYFFADGDGGSYRWPGFAQREKETLD